MPGRVDLRAYSDAINKMKEKPMTDETQGVAAPETGVTGNGGAGAAPVGAEIAVVPGIALLVGEAGWSGGGGVTYTVPPTAEVTVGKAWGSGSGQTAAIEGVDAWAAALELHGISAENAKTLAANCLRDGYAQGVKAVPQDMTATEAYMRAQERLSAERGVTFFGRLEDDVIWAAEEAAYHASNLVAEARGRKPDDGIDAWRKRTGGLRGLHHGA